MNLMIYIETNIKLDDYIAFNFPNEDYFKNVFTQDIVRFRGTINDEDMCVDISNKYEYLSNQFDTFIKKYVSISDEDIKKCKALTTQNCVSPIAMYFLKMFECKYLFVNNTKKYHFTLFENDCKCNFTFTYDFMFPENGIVGNGSYSMLFDVTNNSYSANIELHMNPLWF